MSAARDPGRPVVLRSVEAPGGRVCIDMARGADAIARAEFRGAPEDGHGWRAAGAAETAFDDALRQAGRSPRARPARPGCPQSERRHERHRT
jgi:hypothetical protein